MKILNHVFREIRVSYIDIYDRERIVFPREKYNVLCGNMFIVYVPLRLFYVGFEQKKKESKI